MALKKKGVGILMAIPHGAGLSSPEHASTEITKAENGFIVHVSNSGGRNPEMVCKKYIATSRPQAVRIAGQHFASAMKRGNGKRKGRGGSAKKELL